MVSENAVLTLLYQGFTGNLQPRQQELYEKDIYWSSYKHRQFVDMPVEEFASLFLLTQE